MPKLDLDPRFAIALTVCVASVAVAFGAAQAWADDAFVLPEGVFRFTAATTSAFATQGFDSDGNRVALGSALGTQVKSAGTVLNSASGGAFPGQAWGALNPGVSVNASILREDLAFEYGASERVTWSIQVPLYLSSQVKVSPDADMNLAFASLNAPGSPVAGSGKVGELFRKLSQGGTHAGPIGDILAGAKVQFLRTGESPLSTEPGVWRGAFALGAYLPSGTVASPDSNDFSTTFAESKSWIVGARTYWDHQFTPSFYLDLFTEHQYRFAGAAKYLATDPRTATYQVLDVRYRPGIYNHFEADFTLTPEVFRNLRSDSGLRFAADLSAEGEYTDAPAGYESLVGRTRPSQSAFSVIPYLGVFYTGSPLPVKLKTSYSAVAGGRNSEALSGFTFLAQAYMKF